MSSALLKFQEAIPEPFASVVLAAAVEASPNALAITENGNLIYRNHSFAQLMSGHSAKGLTVASNDAGWQDIRIRRRWPEIFPDYCTR